MGRRTAGQSSDGIVNMCLMSVSRHSASFFITSQCLASHRLASNRIEIENLIKIHNGNHLKLLPHSARVTQQRRALCKLLKFRTLFICEYLFIFTNTHTHKHSYKDRQTDSIIYIIVGTATGIFIC